MPATRNLGIRQWKNYCGRERRVFWSGGRYTTLREAAMEAATSSAVSILLSSTNPSPVSLNAFASRLAASESPSALIIAAVFTCSAFSTRNLKILCEHHLTGNILRGPGLLRLLLRHLLLLHGLSKLSTECEVSNGDIVQDDSELLGPGDQVGLNLCTEVLPLSYQLSGVKLRHDCLEDLVGDAGQDSLVIVLSKRGVNVRQGARQRSTTINQSLVFGLW